MAHIQALHEYNQIASLTDLSFGCWYGLSTTQKKGSLVRMQGVPTSSSSVGFPHGVIGDWQTGNTAIVRLPKGHIWIAAAAIFVYVAAHLCQRAVMKRMTCRMSEAWARRAPGPTAYHLGAMQKMAGHTCMQTCPRQGIKQHAWK